MEKAREASEKALEINPNLGEALTNLAMITMSFDYDLIKASELFKKSMIVKRSSSSSPRRLVCLQSSAAIQGTFMTR